MSKRLRRPKFTHARQGQVGLVMLAFVLLVAFVGPFVAPHDPNAALGAPGAVPTSGSPLGLDQLGRDVLSRLLHGGVTVIVLGTAATFAAYLIGLAVGLAAGYTRSLLDPLLMRSVDILLAFPALLILLLLVAGLGTSVPVMLLGVVLIQIPGIARLVRTATLEVATRGYVEAAVARGDRAPRILVREILPNIARSVLADFGVRFGWSIILIASLNFLGLGLQPPTSDWGLMVAENRPYIATNVWSVLAPAIVLMLVTVSVNLIADSYARSVGQGPMTVAARRPTQPIVRPS